VVCNNLGEVFAPVVDIVRNRTIKLRVAEVVEGGTKTEFYTDLRSTLELSRRVYNMAMSECVAQDSESFSVEGDFGKCEKIATYTTLVKGKSFAKGVTIELSNILRSAETKYKGKGGARFDVLTGRSTVPIARSHPWPLLSNKSAKNFTVENIDGNMYCTIKLKSKKWKVRVASGSNYRYQIRGIMSAAGIGDSKIWMDRKGRAIIGVSVQLDGVPLIEGKTLKVVTSTNALLQLIPERSTRPYSINADHMVKSIARKRIQQQRMRQSIKPGKKRQVRKALARTSSKHARKMRSFVHEATARVISYAKRNGCSRIEYDDSIRSYAKSWPWFDMQEKLKYKCEDSGISFTRTSQPFEPCGNISNPHIYFRLHVAKSTGHVIGLKIGETKDGSKRDTTGQAAIEEIYVAAIDAPKTKRARVKLEKQWLALFAEHKIENEVFHALPVVNSLSERGMINETLGGSRLAEILSLLCNVQSPAFSKPKDSGPSNGGLQSNPSVRDFVDPTCDRSGNYAEGVATYT